VSFALNVRDPLYNPATDFGTITCQKLTEGVIDACPDALNAFTTTNQTFFFFSQLDAGFFMLTAFYKGQSASMNLTVRPAPVPSVNIYASPTQNGVYFYAAVRWPTPCALQWTLNGTVIASTNQTAFIAFSAYPQDGTAWVLGVTATAVSLNQVISTGQATLMYTPPARLTGSCTITPSTVDGYTPTAVTAGNTSVDIASTWSTTSDALRFRFEAQLNASEQWTPLIPFATQVSQLSAVAVPVLPGNPASRTVTVRVQARVASTDLIVGVVKCQVEVLGAARDASSAQALKAALQTQLEDAQSVQDVNHLLQTAQSLAALVQSTASNDTQKQAMATLVASQFATAIRTRDATAMSQTERSAWCQSLQGAVASVTPSSVDATTQSNMVAVLASVVNASTDAQNSLDVLGGDGQRLLQVAAQLKPDRTVSSVVEQLSLQVARQAPLGTQQMLQANGVTVCGTSRTPDSLSNASSGNVTQSGAAIKLPNTGLSLSTATDSSTVSLSVASYATNPTQSTTIGNKPNATMASVVAEFSVQVDGSVANVANLRDAIELRLRLSDSAPEPTNQTRFTCAYFDKLRSVWVNDSTVQFVAYNKTERSVICSTQHLSTFSTFSEIDPQAQTSTTAGNPTSSAAGTTNTASSSPASSSPGSSPSGSSPTSGSPLSNSPTTPPTPTVSSSGNPASSSPSSSSPTPGSSSTQAPSIGGSPAAPADSSSSHTNAAIIGGVIGGVVIVAATAFVALKIIRAPRAAAPATGAMETRQGPLDIGLQAMEGKPPVPMYDRV
jgi:hypothetical protein